MLNALLCPGGDELLFERFGLSVRYVFLSSGGDCDVMGRLSGVPDPASVGLRGIRELANQSARVPAWEPISLVVA